MVKRKGCLWPLTGDGKDAAVCVVGCSLNLNFLLFLYSYSGLVCVMHEVEAGGFKNSNEANSEVMLIF